MQIGMELRKLAAEVADGAYETCRGAHRLTVLKMGAEQGHAGFTLWEARSRGWSPVFAGRVGDDDEVTVTFCAAPTSESGFDLLKAMVTGSDIPSGSAVVDTMRRPTRRPAPSFGLPA